MRVCVRACVGAWVHACVHAWVRVCPWMLYAPIYIPSDHSGPSVDNILLASIHCSPDLGI